MAKDFLKKIAPAGSDNKKYLLAGFSFCALNVLYILIVLWKLPPIDPAMNKMVYGGIFFLIALTLIFSPFILCGKRLLVQILTLIYGGRAIYSTYSLIAGETFPAVPYLLPCIILTFYLLGRAVWDWP